MPALVDDLPEKSRRDLGAGVTRNLQVVAETATGAVQRWIQLNDEATARIMKRETYKNEGTCIATLQWSGDWRPAGALRGRGLSGLQ